MFAGLIRWLWDWTSGSVPSWDYGQTLVIGDETFRAAGFASEGFAFATVDGDAFRMAGISAEAFMAAQADGDAFIAATVSGEVFN